MSCPCLLLPRRCRQHAAVALPSRLGLQLVQQRGHAPALVLGEAAGEEAGSKTADAKAPIEFIHLSNTLFAARPA